VDFGALEKSLSALGLRHLRRIVDGWQSLAVYEAAVDGRPVAVKVVDPQMVDRAALDVRLAALTRLSGDCEWVCGPVPLAGRVVNDVGVRVDDRPDPAGAVARHVIVVAYDFAEGEAPDNDRPDVARGMGRALADLHGVMADLPAYVLPGLAAFPPLSRLEKVAADLRVPIYWLSDALPDDGAGPCQLLHGDFSAKNIRLSDTGWRIFDFDDCGYGAVELDLANSVYFALFDATLRQDPDRYHRFRDGFLDGYRQRSGRAPADERLDALLTRRVLTLASWLSDPDAAPSGIRTASAEWLATLRHFVRRFLGSFETSGAVGLDCF
jgi:Ser/Thr protein kinase RdoA (MazF antagonist)